MNDFPGLGFENEKEVVSSLYDEAFHAAHQSKTAEGQGNFPSAVFFLLKATEIFIRVARLETKKKSQRLLYSQIEEFLKNIQVLRKRESDRLKSLSVRQTTTQSKKKTETPLSSL